MRRTIILAAALFGVAVQAADVVVCVSVDGMGSSYVRALMEAGRLPNFSRFQAEVP